jgi:hypothetical protein
MRQYQIVQLIVPYDRAKDEPEPGLWDWQTLLDDPDVELLDAYDISREEVKALAPLHTATIA